MVCSVEEIHVGDIGTIFEITLQDCDAVVDLTGASVMEIVFKKPDKTVVVKTAALKTDGTDGIIQYITVLDDLNLKGTWSIQGDVTIPTGKWKSEIDKFKVYANL